MLNASAASRSWPANSSFYLSQYNTYVTTSQALYTQASDPYTRVTYFSDHINFTTASLVSSSNPTQSFGIGVNECNATITDIASTWLTVTTSSKILKLGVISITIIQVLAQSQFP